MKTCVCCGDSSDTAEWPKHKTGTPMGNKCWPCLRIFRTATVHLHPTWRWRARFLRLVRRERAYNVVYDDQLRLQGGGCAICGYAPREGELLCFDHNHVTGQFRGLLCDNCNKAAGHMQDDPIRLLALAIYIEHDGFEQVANGS